MVIAPLPSLAPALETPAALTHIPLRAGQYAPLAVSGQSLLKADHRRPSVGAMAQGRALDDAQHARHAWARYRRILGWMNIVALAMAAAMTWFVWQSNGGLPWLFAAFIALGVYGTILLAAALMGLMFLSNGTGHDEEIINLDDGGHPLDD